MAAHSRVLSLLTAAVVVGSIVFASQSALVAASTGDASGFSLVSVLPATGDTWIRINTQANYGDWSTLEAGATTVRDTERVLIKFDLSALPSSATILSADLHVWYERCGSLVYCNDMTVALHRVTEPWEEMTATGGDLWDAIDSMPYALQLVETDEDIWTIWDAQALVEQWHSGDLPNNGLALLAVPGISENYKQFAAREKGDGWAARLVVTWEADPSQIDRLFLPRLLVSSNR